MDKKKITETLEFLESLPTKRLLSYYRAQRKARKLHSYGRNTIYGHQEVLSDAEKVEWDLYIADIKKLLDNREHIEVENDFKCGGKDTTYKRLKERAEELKRKRDERI